MAFKENWYKITTPIKATRFLLSLGYSSAQTQKILDKSRLRQNGKVIGKKDILQVGFTSLIEFHPLNLSLKPLVIHKFCKNDTAIKEKESKICNVQEKHSCTISQEINFCIYNKPPKLLTHPKNLHDSRSLLDQLRYDFGNNSNPCHRLDYDTSGLVLCSLDRASEVVLKNLFLDGLVQKEYFAILEGNITKPLFIESEIVFRGDFGNLCIQGGAKNLYVRILQSDSLEQIKNNYVKCNSKRLATTLLVPLQSFHTAKEMHKFLQVNNALFQHCDSTIFDTYFSNEIKQTNLHTEELFYEKSYFSDLNVFEYYDTQKIEKLFSCFCTKLFSSYYKQVSSTDSSDIAIKNTCRHKNQDFTFVKLIPLSGKTHQLRIHTSSIGHRILGDTLYGVPNFVASFFLDSLKIMQQENITMPLFNLHMPCLFSFENKALSHSNSYKKFFLLYEKLYKVRFVAQNLSTHLVICFFAKQNTKEDWQVQEKIFLDFLLFFYTLPAQRATIREIMRFYYTKSNRLLLHAYKLQFLHNNFVYPDNSVF